MFKACGVITLTTDFGLRDPFVGLMKAIILGRCAQARIIDFTHEIPPQQPQAAGFWLSRSFEYCPRGSIHVAVVDPGVGGERRIIALEANEQVFLAPDNGL